MKKKGFTLIELMIVLAIIAILAVVLVPKASIFKSQSRNAGVYTNMNAVRAYLETKTGENFISSAATLTPVLSAAFTGSDAIENPHKKNNTGIVIYATGNDQPAVVVVDDVDKAKLTLTNYKGSVVVEVATGTYTIYGVDNGGSKIIGSTVAK